MADKYIRDLSVLTGQLAAQDKVIIEKADGSGTKIMGFSDLVASITANILKNNGTTTASGYALDARYGKTLQDSIGLTKKLYGDIEIPANSDLNTYTTPGEYVCSLYATGQTLVNKPRTVNALRLTVERSLAWNGPQYITQTCRDYYSGITFTRVSGNSGSTWSEWSALPYLFKTITTDSQGNAAGFLNSYGIFICYVTHPTDKAAAWGGFGIRRNDGIPNMYGTGNLITAGSTNNGGTVVFKYNNQATAGLVCTAFRFISDANIVT